MTRIATLALALSLAAAPAFAETFTKGTVKKLDTDRSKVTIIHEELVDLDMPAMTMVFEVADPDLLARLSEGQQIEFLADRVSGKLTVTELK
ncbi:copper-binding protein [Roseivivax sp. CAU 1761]